MHNRLDINNDLRLLNKFLKDGSDDTSQDLLDAPVMDFSSKKELHLLGRFIDIVSQADLSPSFRYAREFRTSLKTVYQRTKDKKLTEGLGKDFQSILLILFSFLFFFLSSSSGGPKTYHPRFKGSKLIYQSYS